MNWPRPLPLLLLIGMAGALAGILAARMLAQNSVRLQAGTLLPAPRALAPLRLSDLDGAAFTNASLQGHPSLVYFGYASCPDVCPAALTALAAVRRRAPLAGLQLLFITVDPEHDTPDLLKGYLAAFGGGFIGLRAGEHALAPLLQDLAASADRRELPGGTRAINHTATLYLLDRHGRLAAVFTPPFNPALLDADLRALARASAI
jgi:protein SCO1